MTIRPKAIVLLSGGAAGRAAMLARRGASTDGGRDLEQGGRLLGRVSLRSISADKRGGRPRAAASNR